MLKPTFDAQGDPTDETLQAIIDWPTKDLLYLLPFCKLAWNHVFGKQTVTDDGRMWEFHTGGWAANESIIAAMANNKMFWYLFWQSSERGGHFKFKPIA